jgi:signal transduction histidine kinase
VVSLAAHRRGTRTGHRLVRPQPTTESALVARCVAAERQRIAGALHDDVSSLLFAIVAGVQRAELVAADDMDELRRTVSRVGEQVLEASDRLRTILRSCTPVDAAEGVPAAVQRDLDDLEARSDVHGHLVVRGRVRGVCPTVERVVLNCLRQALFNIERHACAATVVVTLDYRPEELVLVVQDDGRGLPVGYEPRSVPEGGRHWGFTSMARQVEQRGGEPELAEVEEGGTRLRVRLPV